MEIETWKPIKGFLEAYEISSIANIRSNIYKNNPKFIKQPSIDKDGKLRVFLYNGHRHVERKVSRLMAEAFLDEQRPWVEIHFKDNNPANCRLDNIYI